MNKEYLNFFLNEQIQINLITFVQALILAGCKLIISLFDFDRHTDYRVLSLGSSVSRKLPPITFKDHTAAKITSPGNVTSHGVIQISR